MERLDLTNAFRQRFKSDLNPDVKIIKYCQDSNNCYIEILFHNKPRPLLINLDFISDGEEDYANYSETWNLFSPNNEIVDNAKTLIEFDSYSLINCFGELFKDKACKRISNEYFNNSPV